MLPTFRSIDCRRFRSIDGAGRPACTFIFAFRASAPAVGRSGLLWGRRKTAAAPVARLRYIGFANAPWCRCRSTRCRDLQLGQPRFRGDGSAPIVTAPWGALSACRPHSRSAPGNAIALYGLIVRLHICTFGNSKSDFTY